MMWALYYIGAWFTFMFIMIMNIIIHFIGGKGMEGLVIIYSCLVFPIFWYRITKNTIREYRR